MRILIAVDRSEYAEIVVEHGVDQAVRAGEVELHVTTIVPDEADVGATRAWLEAMMYEALEDFGLEGTPITAHVMAGDEPAPAVCALAQSLGADLLVLGRFGAPSEAGRFVRLAPCPTLVIGIDGVVLDAQCPACEAVRHRSDAETLFCEKHAGDRIPDLVTRLPSTSIGSRWAW
jgi:nucleotide-binding universal stress UspA family protein